MPRKSRHHECLRFTRMCLKGFSFGIASLFFVVLVLPEKLQVRQGQSALTPNMSINVFNLMCNIPTPNINVTEEQLLHFWQLPQGVSLSPLMESIGRCRIAVERKSHPDIQPNVCDCVNAWWPLFAFVVTVVYLLSSICKMLKQIVMVLKGKSRWFSRVEYDVEVCREGTVALCWLAVWATAVLTYMLHHWSAGMTYKMYGDLYSRTYYRERWFGELFMALDMVVLKLVHSIVCFRSLDEKLMDVIASCMPNPPSAAKKKVEPIIWKKPQPLCKDVAVQTDEEVAVLYWDDQMDSPSSSSLESVRSRFCDTSSKGTASAEGPAFGLYLSTLFETLNTMGANVVVPVAMLDWVFEQLVMSKTATEEEVDKAKAGLHSKADDKGSVSFPTIKEVFVRVFGSKFFTGQK